MLGEIAALQEAYTKALCPTCEAPCCKRVRYLFCEKDILFLRLSGRKARWKREAFQKKGCWFLGPAGCFLDSHSRPFICHRYLCPDLKKAMNKNDPALLACLEEKFKAIAEMRGQMWAEYLSTCA
ncbi:MAG: hypothetical protein GY849_10730 [Deltaproteobacteria bacterium]|nr:hypothetical protein [Deltaproteobacteria bacterium]